MGELCRYCNSRDVVHFGRRRTQIGTKQLRHCNTCNRTFTYDWHARARVQPEIIRAAVELGEQGCSLAQVRYELKRRFGKKVSRWSIVQWLKKHAGINKQFQKAEAEEQKRLLSLFKGKVILVTGGTGSLGRRLVRELLRYQPRVVRVFDIDETGLFDMERDLELEMPRVIRNDLVRFFVGDVRDRERLHRAIENVDIVFHLASLKHVASCEYNPFEAVKTNVLGTQNLIDAALAHNVERVIYTSSDKAAYPHCALGATRLLAERLLTCANNYKGSRRTIFASVRFGNVMGTRGTAIPLFLKQVRKGGPVTITDPSMTRFTMTQKQAISLIFKCARIAKGGELFILKMPVVRIGDLANVIIQEAAPKFGHNPEQIKARIIGAKPGETHYEELMTEEEANRSIETEDMFIVPSLFEGTRIGTPSTRYSGTAPRVKNYNSRSCPPLTPEELKSLLYNEGLLG